MSVKNRAEGRRTDTSSTRVEERSWDRGARAQKGLQRLTFNAWKE
jgi:hypothetical protein